MSARWRVAMIASTGAVIAGMLTACAGSPMPGTTATGGPDRVRVTASPTVVPVAPSWAPKIVAGPIPGSGTTPPTDAAALAKAKSWIVAATPPPGVKTLDAAPAGAPKQPAESVACDWLVQATKWWSTRSSNADAAKAWITAHPVSGLVTNGSMNGPGSLSAVFERDPNNQDDSLGFEFAQDDDTVAIRVDVIIVPKGAACASGG